MATSPHCAPGSRPRDWLTWSMRSAHSIRVMRSSLRITTRTYSRCHRGPKDSPSRCWRRWPVACRSSHPASGARPTWSRMGCRDCWCRHAIPGRWRTRWSVSSEIALFAWASGEPREQGWRVHSPTRCSSEGCCRCLPLRVPMRVPPEMCGIVGFQGRFSAELLQRMTDAVAHRGPDGEGIAVLMEPDQPPTGLGHRRLAIIDLSAAGRQPMTVLPDTGGGMQSGLTLTFNGEIYNYRELRAELAATGHLFRTATDSEVLLHLYERDGLAML